MGSEPDKTMDELLKASARKRRAEFGADPAMPNPMRARLHEEMAALNCPKESQSRGFSFAWPRFAIAAAVAALVVGLPLLWQWRESAHRPVISARDSTAPESEERERTNEKAADAASEMAAAKSVAQTAAAPAAAKAAGVTQQFLSRAAAEQQLSKANTPGILNNFRLEQSGESVRVVDADGSTYTGRMEPLRENDARSFSNQKLDFAAHARTAAARPPTAKNEPEEPANEYHISASGYNTQLQKTLSFEGNYIVPASSANEMQEKDKISQARIIGTAKIEGAPPVQVDATAVPP
jgi:hypothetical protein